MRNGEMLDAKKRLVSHALEKTNCTFRKAAELVGMSPEGLAKFARNQKLVRRGTKPGQKAWVLA